MPITAHQDRERPAMHAHVGRVDLERRHVELAGAAAIGGVDFCLITSPFRRSSLVVSAASCSSGLPLALDTEHQHDQLAALLVRNDVLY